jgi:nucleotide-binding universal stress UspA family protein
MQTPDRILVPLDLSSPGETKLPVVEGYARSFGAEVILLHVISRSPTLAAIGDMRPLRGRENPDDPAVGVPAPAETAARAYLDAVAARLRAAGVRANPLVREGPIAATVLAVARQLGVGLIVIGSNQRAALSRMMVGDIAQAIVRGAPCPTLLVRPALDAAPAASAIRSFTDDATRAGLLAPRSLGLRTLDLGRIIGSVGKADELGPDFRPLRASTGEAQRYAKVREASATGTAMPPIDLYKLGYGYYVLDGHRRVAAAKALGQDEIEANVTEFLPTDDPVAQRDFTARRAFERATGLTRIGAARPENYARLQEMIDAWGAHHGVTDPREAAERWFVRVLRPQMKRIRARKLGRHFPTERTADTFVRLADHRRALAEERGEKVSWDEALASFATHLPGGSVEGRA